MRMRQSDNMERCGWMLLALVFLVGILGAARATPIVQLDMIEVPGFETPESVAVGPDGRYYVSNIGGNGVPEDGSIKAISGNPFDGTVTVTDVATGLNDPTGTVFVGTRLFVVDDDRVWQIETTGDMAGEKNVFLPPDRFPGGTGMLNDIAADEDGHLFISDTNRGIIFAANLDGEVTLFLDAGPANPLRMPNGVIVDEEGGFGGEPGSVLVIDLRNGNLVAIAPDGSSASIIARRFGAGDGLAFDAAGNLYISDFVRGRVFRLEPNLSSSVIARMRSPADLTVDVERNWLVVPNFLKDTVTFVRLSSL